MIKIEANTLEEAYSKAAAELTCSVTQISFDVIQNPSSGFLGMFKKTAIVEARRINDAREGDDRPKKNRNKNKNKNKNSSNDSVDSKPKNEQKPKREDRPKKSNPKPQNDRDQNRNEQPKKEFVKKEQPKKEFIKKEQPKKDAPKTEIKKEERPAPKPMPKREPQKPKVEVGIAIVEIKKDINALFAHSCFELNEIKVEVYNENTVLVEFGGEDSALLIGKEGYRYKSISYLLYNWINIKYNLNVRLEIAEFLKNQEEMISKYLVGVKERINNTGRAQTKILDGVLVKIALEELRREFPNKYVGIKSGREGGRFIVINDFNRKSKES